MKEVSNDLKRLDGGGQLLGSGARGGEQAHQGHRQRLDEHLGGGARTQRDVPIAAPPEPHDIGVRIALLDAHDGSRFQVLPPHEAQKRRVLIADAPHGHFGVKGAGEQAVVLRVLDRPLGPGYGIAVRID